MKTTNGTEERGRSYEKQLMLECDSVAKEFRMKYDDNQIICNSQVRGILSMKHENKYYDKK